MYYTKTIVLGILIAFAFWLTPGCTSKEQLEIRIAGSTTILLFMTEVSKKYSEKGRETLHVSGGGSVAGVSELIDGKIDIAMSSAPISRQMISHAESTDVQLKGFPFASDLIVPIVHSSNAIKTLSLTQLREIYEGRITSWSELGGATEPIQVVTRRESSGTEKVWQEIVMKSSKIQPSAVLLNSSSGIIAYVAENPVAIGYVSYALLNHEVKPLSINGIAPSQESAEVGKYPISRRLYLYVNEKNLPHSIKTLIVFVLSRKGQQIAKEFGFIPLNPMN